MEAPHADGAAGKRLVRHRPRAVLRPLEGPIEDLAAFRFRPSAYGSPSTA